MMLLALLLPSLGDFLPRLGPLALPQAVFFFALSLTDSESLTNSLSVRSLEAVPTITSRRASAHCNKGNQSRFWTAGSGITASRGP